MQPEPRRRQRRSTDPATTVARAADEARVVPLAPAPTDAPADRELAAIDAALGAAGAEARAGEAGPTPAFAAALRSRLLGELVAAGASDAGAGARAAVLPVGRTVARPIARPVVPSITWRLPSFLPARRQLAMAMAAVLVVGLLGVGASRLLPVAPRAVVVETANALLLRDGAPAPLAAGAELRAGDAVSVAADGRATIAIAGGETRLAGGAELRIDALEGVLVALDQSAGRVWHRVAVPDGVRYRVTTGPVEWTALGTAFDLDRASGPGGREVLHAVGVEHAVRVAGPDIALTVEAGRQATIVLEGTGAPPDLEIGGLDRRTLDDPWLRSNAGRDVRLGFDAGVLTALEVPGPSAEPSRRPSPSPSPSATPSPSPSPSASAEPSPSPSPSATTTAAPSPSPKPTPKATPKATPTPAPTVGALSLGLLTCHGGVVLDWSAYGGDRFHHYTAVRSTADFAAPTSYPPSPPVVALDGTYTKDVGTTSSRDTGLDAGTTYHYRALAFDAEDRVIAASPARAAVAKPVAALGAIAVTPEVGQATLGWSPYGGPGDCFTYYKVVWSTTTTTPSYLGDNDGAIPVGSQSADTLVVGELAPGTYWFRVQAIRTTELGKFIVAQTDVAEVIIP